MVQTGRIGSTDRSIFSALFTLKLRFFAVLGGATGALSGVREKKMLEHKSVPPQLEKEAVVRELRARPTGDAVPGVRPNRFFFLSFFPHRDN